MSIPATTTRGGESNTQAIDPINPYCVHVFLGNKHHSVPMVRFFATLDLDVPQLVCTTADERDAFEAVAAQGVVEFYFYEDFRELFRFLDTLSVSSVFILHGLFRGKLRAELLRYPHILARSSWFCWGADFYPPQTTGLRGFVDQVKDLLVERPQKRRIAQGCQQVLVCNDGDERIMRERMLAPRTYQIQYPLLGLDDAAVAELITKPKVAEASMDVDEPYVIMVGNSAAESNEHLSLFESIAHLASENIRVWSPLGYGGPPEYVASVVSAGTRIFGDRFEAVTTMMDKDVYDARLKSSDALILGHRRQQGLYVAKCALCHGGYLFIREDVSTYQRFRDLGFTLGATEELASMSLSDLKVHDSDRQQENRRLLIDESSEPALRPRFEELIQRKLAAAAEGLSNR